MSLVKAVAGAVGFVRVAIADDSVTDIGSGAGFASYQLDADGDITQATGSGGAGDAGDWITPKAAAGAAYEVRATKNSGDTPSGSALSTWLALNSNRSWALSQSGVGTKACNLTIEIRRASTGAVLDSASIDLEAEGF